MGELDQATRDLIGRVAASGDLVERRQAESDAARHVDLWQRLLGQHWESTRLRLLYTKDYLVAQEAGAGRGTPTVDQLYFALIAWEERYEEHQRTEEAARRLKAATDAVRAQAEANPLAASEFVAPTYASLSLARRDARWCETDIVDAKAVIEWVDPASTLNWKTKAEWLRLIYRDGTTFDVPLFPKPALFRHGLPENDQIIPFFRRHKRTGRLVPFQTTQSEFRRTDPRVTVEEALNAVPARFDAELTPRILEWRDLANSRWVSQQLGVVTQAFGTLSAASGMASLNPATLARGTTKATAPVVDAAVGTARVARSAVQEIRAAVDIYRVSPAAAVAYLGRSAWTFYLRNAVSLNLTAVVGTELTLSLAGADMGPISAGDQLFFAVQTEKAAFKALRTEVEEVDAAAHSLRLKVTKIDAVTAEEADRVYGSGKLIHHEKAPHPAPPAGRTTSAAVDDTKVSGKAVNGRGTGTDAQGVANDGTVAVPKGRKRVAAPPVPASNIHRVELLTPDDLERLEALGIKPEALEKLRSIEIGELQRMGLKPGEITKLYRRISASRAKGGVVVDFINEFHEIPGFQGVVLNWAKGGAARPGTNFAMKYALAKFRGQAIRFEWPVAQALTRTDQEAAMAARYVDIVVDGGTSFRPGEALRIELKSWTERYLSVTRARKTIARQLALDTAFFGKQNIRWVFDASKASRDKVLRTMVQAIREDPILSLQWEGTDDEIRAALDQLVEMF